MADFEKEINDWTPDFVGPSFWRRKFAKERIFDKWRYTHVDDDNLDFCVKMDNDTQAEKWRLWCHVCRCCVKYEFEQGNHYKEILKLYGDIMGHRRVMSLLSILRRQNEKHCLTVFRG